jgi:hypothetical protein
MPGPHGFAVRISAVRLRAADDSRETRPVITLRAQRCRVHRIPPRVNDDGQRPSGGRDGEAYSFDLGQGRTRKFLQAGLDRANQIDPLQQIAVLLISPRGLHLKSRGAGQGPARGWLKVQRESLGSSRPSTPIRNAAQRVPKREWAPARGRLGPFSARQFVDYLDLVVVEPGPRMPPLFEPLVCPGA